MKCMHLICAVLTVLVGVAGCTVTIAPVDDGGGVTPDAGGGVNPDTGGGIGATTDEGAAVTFSNGGQSVEAKTVQTGNMKTTTVSDGGGTLVQLEVTQDGVRMILPTRDGAEETNPLETTQSGLPSDFAINRLATYIAAQLFFNPDVDVRGDNPGCDWFPDTRCTLRCCADHDRCFAAHDCAASSWIPFAGSEACNNCNTIVRNCILSGCWEGSEGDASTDVCYDASCGASYTCPDDPFNCFACDSPCAAPSTCGNGTCEVGETDENCASDCALGLGINICCRENNGCTSETPTSCPGDCCCCGFGEVCQPNQRCGP